MSKDIASLEQELEKVTERYRKSSTEKNKEAYRAASGDLVAARQEARRNAAAGDASPAPATTTGKANS